MGELKIGENIKAQRQIARMSQQELADRLNVSRKTISSWEVNRTEPNMGNIEDLAKALGCRKSTLLGGEVKLSASQASMDFEFINKFKHLSEKNQELVIALIDALLR